MMFYKETDFKETPIGKIPKNWKIARAIDVARYINGYAFSPKDWKTRGVPIIRIQNLNDPNTEFNYFDGEIGEIYKVENGDLLFSWSASIGVYVWNRGKAVLNQHIFKVIPGPLVDKLFLYYTLFLAIEQLKRRVHGSTMKHFRRGELRATFIPLPSLPEQQKIAEILSTVDEAIQKTNEIIAKTERLKKGLMQELLTKGIGHKEFKDTEIGKIPREWEVVRICKLFDLYKGTTPSTKIKEYWDGIIPFVTPTDVTKVSDSNEIHLKATENFITEKGLKSKGLKLVPENSLLFTSRATIGYLAINKVKVAINQGIISLIPKKDTNADTTFFYYFLQKLRNYFENLAGGSTYKEISMSTFSNINVPLPSYQEQEKIAKILSTVDKKLGLERNEKAKLERIKRGLMDLLLTGKIRVKVS
ncbi:MAG: restriction endonuclease subunit S [Thermoprotei archaeon]